MLLCCAKSLQLCLTFCDPMDYNLPGFSVHGILQARILEWVVFAVFQGIFSTQGSNLSLLCLLQWQAGSLPLAPPGKPNIVAYFQLKRFSSDLAYISSTLFQCASKKCFLIWDLFPPFWLFLPYFEYFKQWVNHLLSILSLMLKIFPISTIFADGH